MKKRPRKIKKSIDGFSLTDKRVDKLISKKGFKEYEVFYSPIKVWFSFWSLLFAIYFPFILTVFYEHFSFQSTLIYISIYLTVTYFFVGILNRSFAITDKKFLVINSHFPLWRVQSFNFDEITDIKISSDWKLKILILLGLFNSNYVQITVNNRKYKFYCLFLNVDYHDENWTDKTLDSLKTSLKLKGLNAKLEI